MSETKEFLLEYIAIVILASCVGGFIGTCGRDYLNRAPAPAPAPRVQPPAPSAPVRLRTKAQPAVYLTVTLAVRCRATLDNMPMSFCDPTVDPPCECR